MSKTSTRAASEPRFERLAVENPDALLADGFEDAYLGPARRCGQKTLAAYSMRKALDVLVSRDGMTYEEAVEYFEFNVVGAWAGAETPIWIDDIEDDS